MKTSHSRLLTAAVACAVTFVVGRVTAAGFPSSGSELFYSGQLANNVGEPLITTEELIVQFFDAPTSGRELCATESAEVDLGPTLGGFRIGLPIECVSAVQDTGDVWAQLIVSGARMPRQKLGATPYAIVAREAQHADVAALAVEATRANTVANGSVGTDALADGSVTAEKTDFGLDVTADLGALQQEVSAIVGRIDAVGAERSVQRTFDAAIINTGLNVGQAFPSLDDRAKVAFDFMVTSSGDIYRLSVDGTFSLSACDQQADNQIAIVVRDSQHLDSPLSEVGFAKILNPNVQGAFAGSILLSTDVGLHRITGYKFIPFSSVPSGCTVGIQVQRRLLSSIESLGIPAP